MIAFPQGYVRNEASLLREGTPGEANVCLSYTMTHSGLIAGYSVWLNVDSRQNLVILLAQVDNALVGE